MNSVMDIAGSSFGTRKHGLAGARGADESQRSSLRDRRRKLRFEVVLCENKLAALYTEIDQLDETLDRLVA